jgi:hypothetical protein
MGQRYEYRGIVPTISASAALFPTAEVTGADSGGFRTAIPVDSVQRFRRFSYTPEEVAEGPRVS